eukprot:TRINITY_DN1772_c0_g1_i1.p1 TRINITY_DN1772_c0_g1~~TRINITY_DN1772_c0_g1_i1.p1  ORF type:complete len:137 (-),score=32.04 TRINITY_DN1772_c0_g1_i1:104-514(-)
MDPPKTFKRRENKTDFFIYYEGQYLYCFKSDNRVNCLWVYKVLNRNHFVSQVDFDDDKNVILNTIFTPQRIISFSKDTNIDVVYEYEQGTSSVHTFKEVEEPEFINKEFCRNLMKKKKNIYYPSSSSSNNEDEDND